MCTGPPFKRPRAETKQASHSITVPAPEVLFLRFLSCEEPQLLLALARDGWRNKTENPLYPWAEVVTVLSNSRQISESVPQF